ncbi:hypothetical protein VTP01DRAFT_10173 [Rhizomucor pusillus]|uniref:uncharacterized protein n=1 Tax=Rhizomucor pusillus TaxID=4840 RepID=UPI003743CF34
MKQQQQKQNTISKPRTLPSFASRGPGVSAVKKRIRDLNRFLARGPKNAKKRVDAQRKLQALQIELHEATVTKRETAMSSKYHKIKHFERKKAERRLRKAEAALKAAKTDAEKEEAQAQVDRCTVDLLYTKHFPRTMRYVSLYPKENADDPKSTARREEIRQKIKQVKDNGGDFDAMAKEYREIYRKILIKQGELQEIKEIVDEVVPDDNEDSNEAATADKNKMDNAEDANEDEKDDFFE